MLCLMPKLCAMNWVAGLPQTANRRGKAGKTYDKLGREVIHFLDGRRLTGPLDTDEIRDFAIESVRSPLLPAMF